MKRKTIASLFIALMLSGILATTAYAAACSWCGGLMSSSIKCTGKIASVGPFTSGLGSRECEGYPTSYDAGYVCLNDSIDHPKNKDTHPHEAKQLRCVLYSHVSAY